MLGLSLLLCELVVWVAALGWVLGACLVVSACFWVFYGLTVCVLLLL